MPTVITVPPSETILASVGVDRRTTRGYPVPSRDNSPRQGDVDRIVAAIMMINDDFDGVDDQVAVALSALIGAAPGTLDTIAELAAALGNDPNKITTIMTQLGLRATTTQLDTAVAAINAALALKADAAAAADLSARQIALAIAYTGVN